MKALVTGGGGFLGRAIVRQLQARGDMVRILARSEYPELLKNGVECMRGDISDAQATIAACQGMDAVFHVAAKAGVWGAYSDFHEANVVGTQNIIDACRKNKVPRLIHTSTPSVVYNGHPLANANETLPLTTRCPCAYPLTKAEAERRVIAANNDALKTVAIRPHLIWGEGDNHLVPRVVAQAKAGKLRIVGDGLNRVDLTHVENAAHAHLLAHDSIATSSVACGQAYFVSDNAPVILWDWINALLDQLEVPRVSRTISLNGAKSIGAIAEMLWTLFPFKGEPPMTRFVAVELAKDHWFDISAIKRDLGYSPVLSPMDGLAALVKSLKQPV
ncbi:MAG: NAD-dependent epimerase/dehydratase family protein [Puniceicoccales bacterium]|jgi:nucleoside-diphosphate-sugar epimerase|nr:NAD-dependent epimerase/dehydratase family protein [Puniceicoccales bacterium]